MSNHNSNGKSWAIVIAAIITAVVGPIIVWYVTNQRARSTEEVLQATVSALQTQVSGHQPQPTPTLDLWQFYVDDIKKSVPNASVTTETLKRIAAQIPPGIPYFAEAEVGLIPYQYNGKIIEKAGPVSLNAPEGGYAYVSCGQVKIEAGEISLYYQWREDNVYLILVIGKPEDGTPADLSVTLTLDDFSSGNIYTNFALPAPGQILNRAIVNKAWFSQQLWWAQRSSSITVSIVDLQLGSRFDYDVDSTTFTWRTR